MNFTQAREAVAARLAEMYADERESPKALLYGFDTSTAWAPLIDWAGVLGVYVYLVDKRTGALTPLSFPEFVDMPTPKRVGIWPRGLA